MARIAFADNSIDDGTVDGTLPLGEYEDMKHFFGTKVTTNNPYYFLPRAEQYLAGLPEPEELESQFIRLGLTQLDTARLSDAKFFDLDAGLSLIVHAFAGGSPDAPPSAYTYEKVPELSDAMHDLMEAFRQDSRAHPVRIRIAREALEKSPLCSDAICVLAEHDATNLSEAEELYERAYEIGVKTVIENFDHQYYARIHPEEHTWVCVCKKTANLGKVLGEVGYWGTLITRPLMRAKFGVGLTAFKRGNYRKAREHFHEICIHLTSEDPMACRTMYGDTLLHMLRRDGGGIAMDELLREGEYFFKDIRNQRVAALRYMNALFWYIYEGDGKKARSQLHNAIDINHHVLTFLLDPSLLEGRRPPMQFAEGTKAEAAAFVWQCRCHFESIRGAMTWVEKRATRAPLSTGFHDDALTQEGKPVDYSKLSASVRQKLESALKEKQRGNKEFGVTRYAVAISRYEKGLEMLASMADIKECKDLMVSLHFNIACCHFKMGKKEEECIVECTKALRLDACHSKAWFMRGKARFALDKFASAFWDVRTAQLLLACEGSRDETVHTLLDKLSKKVVGDDRKHHCSRCDSTSQCQLCGRCQAVPYCSRKCQTEDFPVHRVFCKLLTNYQKKKGDDKEKA